MILLLTETKLSIVIVDKMLMNAF